MARFFLETIMPEIILNGKKTKIAPGTTIEDLLREIGVPQNATAVALRGDIVRRSEFGVKVLIDEDEVEVLRAIGGG